MDGVGIVDNDLVVDIVLLPVADVVGDHVFDVLTL